VSESEQPKWLIEWWLGTCERKVRRVFVRHEARGTRHDNVGLGREAPGWCWPHRSRALPPRVGGVEDSGGATTRSAWPWHPDDGLAAGMQQAAAADRTTAAPCGLVGVVSSRVGQPARVCPPRPMGAIEHDETKASARDVGAGRSVGQDVCQRRHPSRRCRRRVAAAPNYLAPATGSRARHRALLARFAFQPHSVTTPSPRPPRPPLPPSSPSSSSSSSSSSSPSSPIAVSRVERRNILRCAHVLATACTLPSNCAAVSSRASSAAVGTFPWRGRS
jgi:hypothetical protein